MDDTASPVVVREVGLRDGLQAIARTLPTEHKLAWIADAYAAGEREIEVGSFVPPRLLPQLADTAELVAYAKTLPGLVVSVLVPNLKGAERAIASEADLMLLPLSASHAHSLANLRKAPDDVVREIGTIRAARDAAGSRCLLEVGLSTAFGCTIQGRVEPDEVVAPGAGRARRRASTASAWPTPWATPIRRWWRSCSRAAPRSPATGSPAATSTTRAASGWPMSSPPGRRACAASTPASPASAAARTRRARAATSPPRTSPISSPAWACRPGSTSTP